MPNKINEYRQKRKQRFLLVLTVAALGLFFAAALMHIGAGDAEWGGKRQPEFTGRIFFGGGCDPGLPGSGFR